MPSDITRCWHIICTLPPGVCRKREVVPFTYACVVRNPPRGMLRGLLKGMASKYFISAEQWVLLGNGCHLFFRQENHRS